MEPPLEKVVTFCAGEDRGVVQSIDGVLVCSDHRGPSFVERQSEFDSERNSQPRSSKATKVFYSDANSARGYAQLGYFLLAVCVIAVCVTAGVVTGYFVGRAVPRVDCGAGTQLSSSGAECIIPAPSSPSILGFIR